LKHGVALYQAEREKGMEVFAAPVRVLYDLLPDLNPKSILRLSWQWRPRTHSCEEVLWSVRLQNRADKSVQHLWRQTAEGSAPSELSTQACFFDCACIPQSDDSIVSVYVCVTANTPLWSGSSGRGACSLLVGNFQAKIASATGEICLHDDNELSPTTGTMASPNTVQATWLSGGFTDAGGQPLAIFEQQQMSDFDELPGGGWTIARQIIACVPSGLGQSAWTVTIEFQCRIAFRDAVATIVRTDQGYEWAVLARSVSTDADEAKIVARGSSHESTSTVHAYLWQQHAAFVPITSDESLVLVVRALSSADTNSAAPFVLVRNCVVWLRRHDLEENLP
jgi:hypothetical protein